MDIFHKNIKYPSLAYFTMLSPKIEILILVLLVWNHKVIWMGNLNVNVNKKTNRHLNIVIKYKY
jgi:hypothetical protein